MVIGTVFLDWNPGVKMHAAFTVTPPLALLSRDKFTYLMTNSTPHSWLLEATKSMALPVPRPCWRVAIPSQLIKCSIIKGGSQWGARHHIRRVFNYTVVSELVRRES